MNIILRSAVTFLERHCTTARQVVILRSEATKNLVAFGCSAFVRGGCRQ